MDRVVSQLLAEVDGVQAGTSGGDLFVIGATNRSALPSQLLPLPGPTRKLTNLASNWGWMEDGWTDWLD